MPSKIYYGYGQPVISALEEFVITGVHLSNDEKSIVYDLGVRAQPGSGFLFNTLHERVEQEYLTPIATDGLWFHYLPVVFLTIKEWGNDLMAMFPTCSDSNNPYECTSYMHLGQHSNASTDWLDLEKSHNASFDKYKYLLVELLNYGDGRNESSCYWNIEVVKRLKDLPGEDQTLAWTISRVKQIKTREAA
jgi:hypothetical protein